MDIRDIVAISVMIAGLALIAKGFLAVKLDGYQEEIRGAKENISRAFGLGLVIIAYGLLFNNALVIKNITGIVVFTLLVIIWNTMILMQKISKHNKHKEEVMAESLKLYAESLQKEKENKGNPN